MTHFIKAVTSIVVTFLIFFGVPVLVYSSFQRFLGMVPPSQLSTVAVYQLAGLKALEAFILVILFLLVIERRRGKERKYAFFLAFLLFVQGGLITELWTHLTLHSPTLYAAAGVCSAFLSYGVAAWFLAKLYHSTSSIMM